MAQDSKGLFSEIKSDFPSAIVVFLVAMPLCLGIALASGAPLFSGLISGIVGCIIVGSLSGSALGVSGPAAGLAVIVLNAITDLGSFEAFLLAVVFGGVVQITMGFLRAGVIAYYFPTAVINGMLAGIGIIIFLKQIPHGVGYDADPEGDLEFFQPDSQNTFSELINMLDFLSPGPMIITFVSLVILILWETKWIKNIQAIKLIQGPLVAVIVGIVLNKVFSGIEGLALAGEQMVNIPLNATVADLMSNVRFPDFSQLTNPQIYITGIILAVVGSLETLLCVEASDKQDPKRRVTPTNRELKAQGVGNIVSGLIGGLPITQVIVRSSVNVQAGGQTKLSAIIHGFIILLAIILIPNVLNLIPLSTLAAILFVVGFKLAKPVLFKKTFNQGIGQFIPFIATILGILFTDLLMGIGLGFVVAVFFILYNNYRIPIKVSETVKKKGHLVIELSEDVSFLKKASIQKLLYEIPEGGHVTIDASKTYYIHQDVIDIVESFQISAKSKNIKVELLELYDHKGPDHIIRCHVDPEEA
ncbi:MAG: SulP family inorganic anion transporter [Pseudomonadota bacterium]